jgi:ferredoxin
MSYKITVKGSDQSFTVESGETILAAAKRQNIILPYGCNNGVCGTCIFMIIEGDLHYPGGQPFALLNEDLNAGKGLCCMGQPSSDMQIELDNLDEDFEPWV